MWFILQVQFNYITIKTLITHEKWPALFIIKLYLFLTKYGFIHHHYWYCLQRNKNVCNYFKRLDQTSVALKSCAIHVILLFYVGFLKFLWAICFTFWQSLILWKPHMITPCCANLNCFYSNTFQMHSLFA